MNRCSSRLWWRGCRFGAFWRALRCPLLPKLVRRSLASRARLFNGSGGPWSFERATRPHRRRCFVAGRWRRCFSGSPHSVPQ